MNKGTKISDQASDTSDCFENNKTKHMSTATPVHHTFTIAIYRQVGTYNDAKAFNSTSRKYLRSQKVQYQLQLNLKLHFPLFFIKAGRETYESFFIR